jgi:hypothetical protein
MKRHRQPARVSDANTCIQFNKFVDKVERIQFNEIVKEQGDRRAHCAVEQDSHASQMEIKFV